LDGAKKGMVQVTRESYADPDQEAVFLHIDADTANANPESEYAQLAAQLLPENPSAVVVTTHVGSNHTPCLDVDNAFVIRSNNLLPSALQFAIDEQKIRIIQSRTGIVPAVFTSGNRFNNRPDERRIAIEFDLRLTRLLVRVDALINTDAASPKTEPQT